MSGNNSGLLSTESWVRVGAALATAALMAVSAGCGTSDSPVKKTSGSATQATAGPSGAAPDALRVMAAEWSYTISGSPHAGPVDIQISNLGEVSHEFGLVRVKDGVTLDQVKDALKHGESEARALQVDPDKEITTAGIAGPHVNEQVVVPLAAGHYIMTSFLPGPGGPQVGMGMIGEFTVLDAAANAPVRPTSNGVVDLSDSAITLPDGFAKGGTFEVKNTGAKPHDFSVAQLAGKPLPTYFQCVAQSFGAGSSIDDCPGVLQGGVTTMQPGESAFVTMVFGKGDFGYVSTQGNGADFKAGLNGTFTTP